MKKRIIFTLCLSLGFGTLVQANQVDTLSWYDAEKYFPTEIVAQISNQEVQVDSIAPQIKEATDVEFAVSKKQNAGDEQLEQTRLSNVEDISE